MGKVGSLTVYSSLKIRKPFLNVFHVHFLSKNYLEHIIPKLHKNYHVNINTGNEILEFIRKNPNKQIKIITLTREPVGRTISDLFQNWQHIFDDIEKVSNEKLKAYIESLDFNYTLQWFDEEFKEYLGFDIYKNNFNPLKGFEIYNHSGIKILCIKLEKLNEVSEKAFEEFLGFKFKLIKQNEAKDKIGFDKYNYLKDNVKINADTLRKIYQSKYMKHFYSVEERNNYLKKWTE